MKRLFSFSCVLAVALAFSYALPITEVLFSPDDRPKNKLLTLIASAKQKIYAAVYMFTDKDIAQALVIAKQKGVDVRVVVDPTSTVTKYAQVFMLCKNKIPVFVFDTKQHHSTNPRASAFAPLMHHKFAVIDGVIWTGSFNWTISANGRNQENVIIFDDKLAHQRYEQQFAVLVQRCRVLSEQNVPEKENNFWRNWLPKMR